MPHASHEKDDDTKVMERITFLANVWVDHLPLDSRPYVPSQKELNEFRALESLPEIFPDSTEHAVAAASKSFTLGPTMPHSRVTMEVESGNHVYHVQIPVPTAPLHSLCADTDTVRVLYGRHPSVQLPGIEWADCQQSSFGVSWASALSFV